MHPTMQWHIPEDQNSQIHHCENLKNSFRSFTFARVDYCCIPGSWRWDCDEDEHSLIDGFVWTLKK